MNSNSKVDVIVAGPGESWGDWSVNVVAELHALGYETRLFDYRMQAIKLVRYGSRKLGRRRMNQALVDMAESLRPKVVLAMKGEILSESAMRKISALGIKTVNWFPDDPHRLEESKRLSRYYDYHYTHCSYAAEAIRRDVGSNAAYLPLAGMPIAAMEMPISDEEKKRYRSDVSFVGGHDEERESVLKALTDFDMKIWGEGWDRSELKPFWAGRSTYGLEMPKVMSCSKVSVNVHRNFGKPFEQYGNGANRRVYEITMRGSLMLCDRKKDVADLFEEGSEVAFYSTPSEAREKVQYYLDHEDERARAAERAKSKALREHTLRSRLAQLMELLEIPVPARESSSRPNA